MTTESKLFFDKTTYLAADGNIVYASDLNNPLTAIETGQTAVVNAMQTGAGVLSATDTGVVNAYVLDPTAALTAYSDGQMVWLKPGNTNTGASTINVSSLGAKAIRSVVRTALVGGELLAGYWFKLKYSSTLDAFVIVSERGKTDIELTKTVAGGTGIGVASTDDTVTVSIEDGGVGTDQLADDAVTQDKIDPSVSFGPKAVQVFTSSGTYNKTPGATVAIVKTQAPGGGGAGSSVSHWGSGGSAGGYAEKRVDLSAVTSETVTIGAVGTGGVGPNDGTAGGTCSFGSHFSVTGGGKGKYGAASDEGGIGVGADINIRGGRGMQSGSYAGGSSVLGDGGGYTSVNAGTSSSGTGYGGGGAGSYGGSPTNGTDGAPGIIIVVEY